MRVIGTIVAILNDSQLLARSEVPGAWDTLQRGDELLVFEIASLPNEARERARISRVEVPKGTVAFDARQSDPSLAILATGKAVHRRTIPRPNPLETILGSGLFMPREETVRTLGEATARFNTDQSFGIALKPVSVGDVVGVD
jgi:hypothetical protein